MSSCDREVFCKWNFHTTKFNEEITMKIETEQSKNYVIHSDNKSSLKSETLTILITEQKYLCKILAMDFQSK